ncbi:hypothetical protein ACBY01_10365 [Sphingomonas sp. ac-8]|uniref:hypothetical protein n=1 Tax=Sphingomonas sp. ac-8 TaxID=3242977 RepID=UPI003A808248
MPTYSAAQLLKLRTVAPPPGKPVWANQLADVIVDPVPATLCGPGLYALFLDGALFYIGLHVGAEAEPSCSVLHRWMLHVVGQTLRSPRISFSRGPLRTLLDALPSDAMIDALADCLPDGRATDLGVLGRHPLIAGSHCTSQKAAFAAVHWDVFGPGHEAAMLDRITCLFHPVAGDWEGALAGATGRERGDWVRERWLRGAETALVAQFRPVCNAATPLGTRSGRIGVAAVRAAMVAALPPILPRFDRDRYDAQVARRRAAPAAIAAAYATGPGTPDDEELLLAEEEGVSPGELRVRRRLTERGTALVDALRDHCPSSLELYFTDTPDLRIRLAVERSPLLVIRTAGDRLRCDTRASVKTCRMLGHAAEAVADGPMKARFYLDPESATPGDLLALVGAALPAPVAGLREIA